MEPSMLGFLERVFSPHSLMHYSLVQTVMTDLACITQSRAIVLDLVNLLVRLFEEVITDTFNQLGVVATHMCRG